MDKSFLNASAEEINNRLNQLSQKQDFLDLRTVANSFLILTRCTRCLRLNNKGYCCIHCGYGGEED